MAKEFGDVLKEIRVDRGYSQQYVAEGIMGQSAYSKIERNEIEPTFRKWLAILEKLNVSVDEFFLSSDNPVKSSRRRQLESKIDNFTDADLVIMESVADGIVKYKEMEDK